MHNGNNINNTNLSVNQASAKSKATTSAILEEEEMNRMKEQQMLLERELERVRTMLMNSHLKNVPQQTTNDDLSIMTNTENHFQAELENIDQEINNLNAKKEKLIQSLKRKENNRQKSKEHHHNNLTNHQLNLEDGTDLFTDDDAIFSTVNSIDFERVLDDNLSLCTDVDDLELSKHENEYVNTLKAEYEQNLKQLEEERKKSEQTDVRQQVEQSITNDDETTTETTIYKTLRMAKRKYDSSKLNKQLTFDSGDVLRIDNVEIKKNVPKQKLDKEINGQNSKLKFKNNDTIKLKDENEICSKKSNRTLNNNNLLSEPSLDDDLLPSEISQLLLDSALIIYEQLKPTPSKPPKRSTGSSVSSERSIDDQSDEDNLNVICQPATPQTNNIIKQQPKVSSALPSISATLLDLNRDLTRDLNRNIEREINSIHHSGKLNHRSPVSFLDNKRLMRELMFDADCGLNKLKDSKVSVNGRGAKMNKKKKSDKSVYASKMELEEERTRVF